MQLLRAITLLLCLSSAFVGAVEQFTYRVTDKLPQSRQHFVQGLQIIDGELYVSTGNYGQSRLLRYRFPDGELEVSRSLHPRIFAEGVTVLDQQVYQLTWQNRLLLVYERAPLTPKHSFPLPGEGWGITNNGEQLIYSDGSDKLHFVSPETGQIERSLSITETGKPLHKLNELEWVDGQVWSNIWQTERIVIIDPASGLVTGSIDLGGLLPDAERERGTDVLNGIARDPATGDIWVTGKRWPWMYRIEVLPKRPQLP